MHADSPIPELSGMILSKKVFINS